MKDELRGCVGVVNCIFASTAIALESAHIAVVPRQVHTPPKRACKLFEFVLNEKV